MSRLLIVRIIVVYTESSKAANVKMSIRSGFLYRLEERQVVRLVGINEVASATLSAELGLGKIGSIGVRGLSACTVVIVASRHRAILAHVAPNELESPEEDSYIKLAHRMMDDLFEAYRNHSQWFAGNTRTWVVYAVIGSDVATPEQKDIITSRIKEMNLPEPIQIARPLKPFVSSSQSEGTVVVIGSADSARLFVEDREIANEEIGQHTATPAHTVTRSETTALASSSSNISTTGHYGSAQKPEYVWNDGTWGPKPAATAASSVAPPVSTTPTGTRWDGQYHVSTANPAYAWISGAWGLRPGQRPSSCVDRMAFVSMV
ncbi:hypothetical protein BU24DRAFT_417508 [Aaosphaeria arxii CBS 175.79]|uniref:Uncharacterized protein n=1 Tax=Aaosphaeria arxii CBS 175.79 TaxID=1450172 RepID=A0A6A5Y8I2_9PLEO|nr:uncharacterized protein BU24DRAFT_417508 [Aaosphaeria arxii CBS 175.79]KAF2021875.1 hypothetical protein BU24DRAFT_417508 [Aaosphaeria arxii CBS 175.79]